VRAQSKDREKEQGVWHGSVSNKKKNVCQVYTYTHFGRIVFTCQTTGRDTYTKEGCPSCKPTPSSEIYSLLFLLPKDGWHCLLHEDTVVINHMAHSLLLFSLLWQWTADMWFFFHNYNIIYYVINVLNLGCSTVVFNWFLLQDFTLDMKARLHTISKYLCITKIIINIILKTILFIINETLYS